MATVPSELLPRSTAPRPIGPPSTVPPEVMAWYQSGFGGPNLGPFTDSQGYNWMTTGAGSESDDPMAFRFMRGNAPGAAVGLGGTTNTFYAPDGSFQGGWNVEKPGFWESAAVPLMILSGGLAMGGGLGALGGAGGAAGDFAASNIIPQGVAFAPAGAADMASMLGEFGGVNTASMGGGMFGLDDLFNVIPDGVSFDPASAADMSSMGLDDMFNVIPDGVPFTPATAAEMASMGIPAGAQNLFQQIAQKFGTSAAKQLLGGGQAGGAAGGGGLGSLFGGGGGGLGGLGQLLGGYGSLIGPIASLIGGGLTANAANHAADTQLAAANAGIDEQRRQFDTVRGLLQPYVDAGKTGLGGYMDLSGLNGGAPQQGAIGALQSGPQFGAMVQQGEDAILQNAAATGGLRGGNVQDALAKFRANTLSGLIDKQLGRYGGLAQMGQNSATGLGSQAMTLGTNVANLLQQGGAAQAGGIVSANNAITGAVGNIGGFLAGQNAAGTPLTPFPGVTAPPAQAGYGGAGITGGGGFGSGLVYGNQDMGQYF